MAGTVDDQGLASSLGHEVHPWGSVLSSWLVEICALADVVDLRARRAFAEFAAPGEEPVDQLVPLGAGHDGPLIGEDGRAHSPEGYPAERVTSGFLPLSRSMVTCRTLRGPAGVTMTALYFLAILPTVERCLPASVLSSEVSVTQCRRPRRKASWASR